MWKTERGASERSRLDSAAPAPGEELDVLITVTDPAGKVPVTGLPLRLVLSSDPDPRAPDAGRRYVTDAKGRVRDGLRVIMESKRVGLDIPLVSFLGAGFQEKGGADVQTVTRPEGDALARYGSNMVPVDFHPRPADPTRVFVYPYAQTRRALDGIAAGPIDPHQGWKLRYVNPATGASPMPTIGAFAQKLPAGFETRATRCTDSTIHVCLEGEGTARIGEQDFAFARSDVFVVPSWHPLRLQARRDSLLFSYSDRPVQQALGLWREQKD